MSTGEVEYIHRGLQSLCYSIFPKNKLGGSIQKYFPIIDFLHIGSTFFFDMQQILGAVYFIFRFEFC